MRFVKKIATKVNLDRIRENNDTLMDLIREEYPEVEGGSINVLLKNLIKIHFLTIRTRPTFRGVFQGLKKVIDIVIPVLNTRRQFYSDCRGYIKQNPHFGKEDSIVQDSYRLFSITRGEAQDLKKKAQEKIQEKHENLEEVDFKQVLEIMDELQDGIWYEKIMYVMLATGVRFNEVLHLDTMFQKVENTEEVPKELESMDLEKLVYITGISKIKSKESRESVVVPIVHGKIGSLLKILSSIRKSVDKDITRKQIAATWNVGVNSHVKKYFPGKTSHFLRKVYATMSYDLYAPKNLSLTIWTNRVLGHAGNTFSTSINYNIIQSKKGQQNEVVKDYELENKVENLSGRVDLVEDEVDELKEVEVKERKNIIKVKNKDGKVIFLQKNERRKNGGAIERCLEMIKFLEEKNVQVSNKLLRQIGFGAQTAKDALLIKQG